MNKYKIFSLLTLLVIMLIGCSTEDYFGQLPDNEMFLFQLEGQVGTTQFKNDTIFVIVSDDLYLTSLSNLSAENIKVSDYATFSPTIGEKQDFSKPVPYMVTAENGDVRTYIVIVQREGSANVQLPNSNFEFWHQAEYGGRKYDQIGVDKNDKTWATGNQGASFAISLGANAELPSQPYIKEDGKIAARLVTQDMGALAAGFGGKGIAAGNLFAGIFDIGSVTNAHPVFGIPYTNTPVGFSFEYKYIPAKGLLNGKRQPVEGEDAADMYVILEKREGKRVKRLGAGWYRVSKTQNEWKKQYVEIKYARNGRAPEDVLEPAKYVLKYGHDGYASVITPGKIPEATWGDIGTEKPTHIIVVFSSSYQGDYFIGAPGSELLVDNFELVYDKKAQEN